MNYRCSLRRLTLAVGLSLFIAALAGAALAQSPVAVKAIEPPEGAPGQTMEVTVFGRGFGEANEVRLAIEDIEVLKMWVLSDEALGAMIAIPEDAPPGPRTVEVTAVFGPNEVFSDALPGGFRVVGSAAPQEPPQQGDGQTGPEPVQPGGEVEPYAGEVDWAGLLLLLAVAGVILVGGAALAVTLTVKWGRSLSRQKWESQATDRDLPETCQKGTHFVRREKVDLKPGRWKVQGVKVTLYDAQSGARGGVHKAPPEVVKELDRVARQRLLHGDSETLQEKVREIGRELTALVLAWQSLSESGRDIYLETRLEGGQAKVRFVRYRCEGPPVGWRKRDEWTVKLKALDHLPRALRGPHEGETQETYAAFLDNEINAYLQTLIEEAGRLF